MDPGTVVRWVVVCWATLLHTATVVCMDCSVVQSSAKIPNPPHSYSCHHKLSDGTRMEALSEAGGVGTCTMLACKESALRTQIVDRKLGKLEVELPALAAQCGFTRYELFLERYDTLEPLHQPQRCEANLLWRTHSTRNVYVDYCNPNDVPCLNASLPCSQVHRVAFKYVYAGWYRLTLIPHIVHSTRQPQRSFPFQVLSSDTDYVKKLLVDLSVNASLQYRDDNHESHVAFLFGPELEFLGVDKSLVILKLVAHVDPSLGEESCYETGREQGCCAFYGGSAEASTTLVRCTMYQNRSKPHCDVHSGEVRCTFYNMTQGNYCVIVSFDDDRCKDDTVWTTRPDRPCRWHARKEFRDEVPSSNTVIGSSSDEIYTGVAVAALLIVIVISIFIFVRQRSARRQRLAQAVYEEQQVERLNPPGHAQPSQYSFSEQLTLTSRPRPEVLLVYSRDSKPFMDLILAFRRILENICKCQVYDYFDDELWNTVSEDPQGWVRTLILERHAKVVIVASEVSALRHRAHFTDAPSLVTYKEPHPFDNLFLYSLKLIRDGMDQESYKNHFVVTFDGYTESNHSLEHFNPYMRFVIPKHLNKLFEHLHEHSTVHFDTSRKLEERFEVRKLRMHLEHLINLKLLTQSNVTTDKLYDWDP